MTDPTDDIARLKAALKAAPAPEVDQTAMARAVAAARQEFFEASQGSAQSTRPKQQRANWLANLLGRVSMSTIIPVLRPYYYGGASLAVMVVAVMSTGLHEKGFEGLGLSPLPEVSSLGNEAERVADVRIVQPPERDATIAHAARPATRVDQPPSDQAVELDTAPQALSLLEGREQRRTTVAKALADRTGSNGGPVLQRGAAGAAACTTAAGCDQAGSPQLAVGDFERSYAPGGEIAPAPAPVEPQSRDRFAELEINPVKLVAEEPVSTFSIDVDTASYAFVRRAIMSGRLPPEQAVRVEEMVNYFAYDYAGPQGGEAPFAVHPVLMQTPWNPDTQLLRIALKGYDIVPTEKPRSNLVFLIDTSGSMQSPDKLNLVVNSLRLMLDSLGPEDKVGIVTYAGRAGVALPPTPVSEAGKIRNVLNSLGAGGSTAGAAGIEAAYALAEDAFVEDGVNRVILATDGDFNVGLTDQNQLKGYVERKRESGVMLSILGVGQGNYNDALMQTLAQNGNGTAAYIDTLAEARKVLVEEASSTLFPIAQDVKIQVEFNPATVAEYRLIGYETRALNREDFNNDKVDAGEIGSGHRVTALYEITPVGSPARQIDDLRYGKQNPASGGAELAFLKLRYKEPGETASKLISRPITQGDTVEPDSEARFAAAVAGFAQLLRGGRYTRDYSYDDVLEAAGAAKGADRWGYRAEFLTMVRLAKSAQDR
ncbi:MAG: VWA domain-containing protein [Pseudomonadota bacterium]